MKPTIARSETGRIRKRPGAGLSCRRTASESDAAVLDVLIASNRPLTAYQIVEHVSRVGRRIAPMQVYRVLDRLIAAGRAMRVECASAYTASPGEVRAIALCECCGRHMLVESLPAAEEIFQQISALGFEALRQIVEILGICDDCRAHAIEPKNIRQFSRRRDGIPR